MKSTKFTLEGGKYRKLFLFITVFTVSFVYIAWRLFFTLPLKYGAVSLTVGIILLIAEVMTAVETFTHFRNAYQVKFPEMPVIPDEMYPDVDILITTHNETEDLLFKTVNGCKFMKYPDKSKVHIWLCDDKNRPGIKEMADRMGVGYVGFSGNKHAKAGNINYALTQISSPLFATLDADMIPTSDFLMEIVPYFFLPVMIKDKKTGEWRLRTETERKGQQEVGYVQTLQSFYNLDMLQRNLYLEKHAPNEQDYFYRAVNPARMNTGSAAYAGSNAIFLRKAVDDIGGIATHSITEDFATSTIILGHGYRSLAVDKELAHGLSPDTAYTFIKQRQRWSRGGAQSIMSMKFWRSKLPLQARWNFIAAYLYWWTFVQRFIFIMCPILYGVFGVVVADVYFLQLMIVWLLYYVIYNTGLKIMSGGTINSLWSSLIDTIQFPYLIWPIIAGTLKIPDKKFFVTPKDKETGKNSSFWLATPHLILLILSIISLNTCVHDILVDHYYGSIIIVFWLVYNLFSLCVALVYYWGRTDKRTSERSLIALPIQLRYDDCELWGMTQDISEGGVAVILDGPEYLPIKTGIELKLEYKEYKATFRARIRQVRQVGAQWKYSFVIVKIDEHNKEQFLQIIYDRDHVFPRVVRFNFVTLFRLIYRGLKFMPQQGERRLPRINLGFNVKSPEAGAVEVKNFNYKYILIKKQNALPNALTLFFTNELFFKAHLDVQHNLNTGDRKYLLYEIENWEELALNPALGGYLKSIENVKR